MAEREIISRKDAALRKLKRYFTGAPCRHGHVVDRRTGTGRCTTCESNSGKTWYAKHGRGKKRHYKRRWLGYPEPTRPQPKRCECCSKSISRLCLDHDHTTKKFRGWLCNKCNRGLGYLGDTVSAIRLAVRYLERNA